MFAGPGQGDDSSQVCPWELNPAQWSHPPPDAGLRHYPSVREQCGCVVRGGGDVKAHPFCAPHPLPHLQVKGQGYRYRRTVRYVSVDEEGEGCGCPVESCHSDSHHVPNGHSGPRPLVYFEGGEERDSHQDRGRLKGGSEDGCNGRVGSHKAFFPTEVPQRHLNQSRQKGPRCVPPPGPSKPSAEDDDGDGHHERRRQRRHQGAEVAKQKTKQDLVRDQIRQVVTDLEGVLGGLKQVHVEMKEVVEQIDRLTAGIDLSEETPSIALGSSGNIHGPLHLGDLRLAPLPNHKPSAVPAPHHVDEDRIILRTNSPSPVHMASVVKTSRFTPPNVNHEKPGTNGHPPHLYPPRDSNHVGHTETHPPQSLDPKVIIGNSTQKPPLYPQNGRCGKYQPAKPVRTPAYPGRGRQNASMV